MDDKAKSGDRIARVAVSPQFLLEIMRHGLDAARVVKDPLPDDVVFLAAFSRDGLIWLVLTSQTFAPIVQGDEIPELPTPAFTKYDPRYFFADRES